MQYFSNQLRITQNYFVDRDSECGRGEGMGWIFEWQLIVISIVRHISVVMHHQKLPKGNIANQFFMLGEMFHEQWQPKHLMHLCVGVDVEN